MSYSIGIILIDFYINACIKQDTRVPGTHQEEPMRLREAGSFLR